MYDLGLGQPSDVSLTLLIPEEQNRRKGYGTEACALMMDRLAGSMIIKDVKVALDNPDLRHAPLLAREGVRIGRPGMAEMVLTRHLRTTRTGILVS